MTPAERLAELVDGANPRLIRRMRSGFAVMHESQFLPGYCLLLAYPLAPHLNELKGRVRSIFFDDMALLGDAVMAATDCVRVNYSIYGNLDPFLHAHVVPRYEWELDEHRTIPPLMYPAEVQAAPSSIYNHLDHCDLKDLISQHLHDLLEHHNAHHESHHRAL